MTKAVFQKSAETSCLQEKLLLEDRNMLGVRVTTTASIVQEVLATVGKQENKDKDGEQKDKTATIWRLWMHINNQWELINN